MTTPTVTHVIPPITMTTVTLPGYLSKKEIEATHGRSYRSLTRDITRAVKVGDLEVLRHLKLVTDDEEVREGTEVNLDMIQDLSNRGLRPMWFAEELWVADWCTGRADERRKEAEAKEALSTPHPSSPNVDEILRSPTAHHVALGFQEQQIADLRRQIEVLYGQLQIKDDQIRTANQLAEQSQQLMRELHILLKNVQDGLLGEGSRRQIAAPSSANKTATVAAPAITPPQPAVKPGRPPRRSAKPRSPQKNTKRSVAANMSSTNSTYARLQRWLPTFLGSKRRG